MKYLDKKDIEQLEKLYRANLINSISGYKSANLIGTINEKNQTNLAIFSSVFHLGANPALLGFVQRPLGEQSHTYKYIKSTGFYTINHVCEKNIAQAHYTSARFDQNVSEFDACQLTPEFLNNFEAPYVKECAIKIGMKFVQEIPIELNGTTIIIGSIEQIWIPQNFVADDGNVCLDEAQSVAVAGLETYYSSQRVAKHTYAKVGQLPNW